MPYTGRWQRLCMPGDQTPVMEELLAAAWLIYPILFTTVGPGDPHFIHETTDAEHG